MGEELGKDVGREIRTCAENPVEQSRIRVKHRCYPTLRFSKFEAAHKLCKAVSKVDNFLRPFNHMAKFMCLSNQRRSSLNR